MNILKRTNKLHGHALAWAYARALGYEDDNEPLSQHDEPEEELCFYSWLMKGPEGQMLWLSQIDVPHRAERFIAAELGDEILVPEELCDD